MGKNDIYKKYRERMKEIIYKGKPSFVKDQELEEFSNFLRDNWSTDNLRLYRYSPANYNAIRSFEMQTMHLSTSGNMNDIYEGLPVSDMNNIRYSDLRDLQNLIYLKSFSETNNNILMWSHYADEGKGICVEYDLSIIDESNCVLEHIFPVVYSEKRYMIDNIHDMVKNAHEFMMGKNQDAVREDDGSLDNMMALFLTKGKAWEYEREWRIIYALPYEYDEGMEKRLEKPLPFDCATGIYLGCKMPEYIKEHICEIAERINKRRGDEMRDAVTVYQAKLSSSTYDFEFDEI